MKDTKEIDCLKEAIKEQHLDINYYVEEARSIVRELESEGPIHRDYVYEKIKHLKELEDY
jgi:hypothetical protein